MVASLKPHSKGVWKASQDGTGPRLELSSGRIILLSAFLAANKIAWKSKELCLGASPIPKFSHRWKKAWWWWWWWGAGKDPKGLIMGFSFQRFPASSLLPVS